MLGNALRYIVSICIVNVSSLIVIVIVNATFARCSRNYIQIL